MEIGILYSKFEKRIVMNNTPKKKPKRTSIPQERILRPRLQKEIGSRCPFCPSEDISHFEIHHIDEDRTNHIYENLLLLCKHCHSKFTKREWDLRKGREKKDEILKIRNLRLLESLGGSFDYTCYNMKSENGRLREEIGNGSAASIKVVDPYNIQITLKQSDGRIWKGELFLKTRNYGELFFIYENNTELEVGRKECFLRQIFLSGSREDQFYFKPLTDMHAYTGELLTRTTVSSEPY
ncbi:MAG TPA: HNH endonuclease [Chitinophagales bacterium]|nr:HNH endonuclease [Chitinophagales bacterium]